MYWLFSRAPVIVDTAPPPPRSLAPQKPVCAYMNATASTAGRVLNTSMHAVNSTFHNISHHVISGANKTIKAVSGATMSAVEAVESAGAAASNTTTTTATTTRAPATTTEHPWTEDLNKMATTSVSERASSLSLVHMFAWFLLFATLTMTTVVLLNWCLRSSQTAVDDHDDDDDEEMPAKAFVLPSSSSTQGTLAEGTNSASSSSNRLLASRGNLARQQFLESRKTGGTTKNYGTSGTA